MEILGMKKVLVAYFSITGKTEKMAQYIAEGIRMMGHEAMTKKVEEIESINELTGYDGYIFGCPTYHRDITSPMKTFLILANKSKLEKKLGAAFGSYTHSGDAPSIIFDTMQHVFKMNLFHLGSFNLKEAIVETMEGIRACQDYGKVFGEALNL
jgi:flavodoxin